MPANCAAWWQVWQAGVTPETVLCPSAVSVGVLTLPAIPAPITKPPGLTLAVV